MRRGKVFRKSRSQRDLDSNFQKTRGEGPAARAKDVGSLQNAVSDAAAVGAGLWISYLFVLFYLAIAIAGVTHRDLLFENPVKLPFLNVDLPLTSFFIVGPLLFLVLHTYLLLHVVLLVGKVGAFHAELQAQVTDDNVRADLRRQLPSNIFVQYLAGPQDVRTGAVGIVLRLIAHISLVVAPLALLLLFLLQFLPYHHEFIAWWQRLILLADLVLLWVFWPSVVRGKRTTLTWRTFRSAQVALPGAASVALVLLTFTIVTFPGEWLYANFPSMRLIPISQTPPTPARPISKSTPTVGSIKWTSLHELLLAGEVDFVARRTTSLWSNRLVAANVDIRDRPKFDSDDKIAAVSETISFRGRRLERAVLLGGHLRKADFTAAQLQGAVLSNMDLRGAKFGCEGEPRQCAQMQDARLVESRLQEANFDGALMQDAYLMSADLRGATLDNARLDGATLDRATMQGASFDGAVLDGAWLRDTELQGASFFETSLLGAMLDNAQLEGAFIENADLGGASLNGANLQGASLFGSRLQGVTLVGAQLHGANLEDADLRGTLFLRSHVWRTNVRKAESIGIHIAAVEARAKYQKKDNTIHDWSADAFASLKGVLEKQVSNAELRDAALTRIAVLDPVKPPSEASEMAKIWDQLARSSLPREEHNKHRAEFFREFGCSNSRVLSNVLSRLELTFGLNSPQSAATAGEFLNEVNCPAAVHLSQEEKSQLTYLWDRSQRAPEAAAPSRAKN